jgi:hypothetical protein
MADRRMLALTILQPWAALIVRGPKRVENRTWAPRGLKVGDYLALHAGVFSPRLVDHWAGALDLAEQHRIVEEVPLLGQWRSVVDGERGRLYPARCKRFLQGAVPHGAVVGVAQLVGVERAAPAGDPWWCGPVGWRLGNVVAIAPVPCRGAQGLWTLDESTYLAVREAFRIARGGPHGA